jgi:hypothetical protein
MDECSSNQTNLQCTHGCAPSGQRVPIRMSFWIRGTRISTLLGMSANGLLAERHYLDSTIKSKTVEDFIEFDMIPSMNPYPGPRSLLILDNAQVHQKTQSGSSKLRRAPELCFVYLPLTHPKSRKSQWFRTGVPFSPPTETWALLLKSNKKKLRCNL